MSTFASLCRDNHEDPIDVAWSLVTDEVRLWVKLDEDGQETTTYLTVDEAKHLIDLIHIAIEKIQKPYVKS